jgi:methionine sulfoxide reductase heme-binding subunit
MTYPYATWIRARPAAVWGFRTLLVVPFVLMGPAIISAIQGRPGSAELLSGSIAGVLGTSSFLMFALMLAVTPIRTVTGWRWHVILRRDYGVAMFLVAFLDLILAALTTGDTFSGGLVSRVAGRALLLAGTLATALTLPLAVTANRRAQRWLGPHWRRLHALTYVIWLLILLHLFLLFGMTKIFVNAVLVSVPLLVLRVPPVRRWWNRTRRRSDHRVLRATAALALSTTFIIGMLPFIQDLAADGSAAFTLEPPDD